MAIDMASLSLTLAGAASTALFIYLGAGAAFALIFNLGGGLARLDPAARGGTLPFRLLILPATVALWPWLLFLWRRRGGGEEAG